MLTFLTTLYSSTCSERVLKSWKLQSHKTTKHSNVTQPSFQVDWLTDPHPPCREAGEGTTGRVGVWRECATENVNISTFLTTHAVVSHVHVDAYCQCFHWLSWVSVSGDRQYLTAEYHESVGRVLGEDLRALTPPTIQTPHVAVRIERVYGSVFNYASNWRNHE